MTTNQQNKDSDIGTGQVPFTIGDWYADPKSCVLAQGEQSVSLEPKIMDLLVLLCSDPNHVFSRAQIEDALWANVIVGEDTLARAISKLRRALGDSAATPAYIETIPKRGYRVIATIEPMIPAISRARKAARGLAHPYAIMAMIGFVCAGLAWAYLAAPPPPASEVSRLTNRAGDLYMHFDRADNEAAIAIYKRVIATDPDYAPAQAGLANALVQRVIRWPNGPGQKAGGASSLHAALRSGLTQTKRSEALLKRAAAFAERAVRLAPDDAHALKALGFVYSAQGKLDRAASVYHKAITHDPDAWDVLINLGEIAQINNNQRKAVGYYEKAYAVMDRVYTTEPQRIGPWRAPLGILIGTYYEGIGKAADAEIWYRRVLDQTPFEPEATTRLAALLRKKGDIAEAKRLCSAIKARVSATIACR